MIINHNIAALNTHRQLGSNNAQASKNLEKLSSGLKINRAGDDAAGLAISEKMRGQIRGLDMAQKNSQDGISLIQTAEGALNETHSILQRMRELAVQAGNDTNTDSDRGEIQKEINQLTSEVNRIGNTTEFNTKKLLNSAKTDIPTGVTTAGVAQADAIKGEYTMDLAKVATGFDDGDEVEIGGNTYVFKTATPGAGEFNDEASLKALIEADLTDFGATVVGNKVTLTQTAGADLALPPAGTTTVTAGKSEVTAVPGVYTFDLDTSKLSKGQAFVVGKQAFEFGTDFKNATELATLVTGDYGAAAVGNTITLTQETGKETSAAPEVAIVDKGQDGQKFSANLQIGANQDQAMSLDINDMRAAALGITGSGEGFTATNSVTNGTNAASVEAAVDVSTHANAAKAVTTIQSAIDKVSAERSKLGASQNRLEHTINNLGTSAENLTEAESRIRDVDMAKEMMDFTKNNILTQAAQAMLAQANQQPQGVLQLLR